MKTDKFNSVTHTAYWSYQINKLRSSGFLSKIKSCLKYFINTLFLNNFGFALVQKTSIYRSEQRSYTKNFEVLSLRNRQIADFLIQFGLGFGIEFDKGKLLKNIERYEELFRTVKISNLNGLCLFVYLFIFFY